MDGVSVDNSAGVTQEEPNTTNLHGIQESSLYCSNLFNNKSESATNASVKRVTQRVTWCKYPTAHSADRTTSGVNCTCVLSGSRVNNVNYTCGMTLLNKFHQLYKY